MRRQKGSKPVREGRFSASFSGPDLHSFRRALVDLAGGFTEIEHGGGARYIVGLKGRNAERFTRRLLTAWGPRCLEGSIELEERKVSPDRDDIYFLLPL